MPIQSPREFLAATIPAEVRNDPAHRDNIELHLNNLEPAAVLTDSERIQRIYARGVAQDARAERADMIEGIHNGCRFFNTLALESGNKNLGNATQLISSGTQLYTAYSALASAGNFAACVNPIATAALAAHTIFSMCRKKKRRSDPFAEAMMQNFAFISNQVHAMHADMFRGFERSFEYHERTLKLIAEGFVSIQQSQHDLHYQATNNHIIIATELQRLSWYVHSLGQTLVEGQESISLDRFSVLLGRADGLIHRNLTHTSSSIQETADELKGWIVHRGSATKPIYTGIKFLSYARTKPELCSIINNVINPFTPYNIGEWQGFLAAVVKHQFVSVGLAQTVDEYALFNPDLWIQAASRYLQLRHDHPGIVLDRGNVTLNSIIEAIDTQLIWENEKRHSRPLFEALIKLYEDGIERIKTLATSQVVAANQALNATIRENHPQTATVEIDLALPIDQLIARFAGRKPLNKSCQYEASVPYYCYSLSGNTGGTLTLSLYQAPQSYMEVVKQKMNFDYLPIIAHPEFLLAEMLGLISITSHLTIQFRKPERLHQVFSEPDESVRNLNAGRALVDVVTSKHTYTLKAVVNGVSTTLQMDEYRSCSPDVPNAKFFVRKPPIENINETLTHVREMINNHLNEKKRAVIRKLFTHAELHNTLKDEALSQIEAAIRLLSMIMLDWPNEMRQEMTTHIKDAASIVTHLLADETHALSWDECFNGMVHPQFQLFKERLFNATANVEDYFLDNDYVSAMKELKRVTEGLRAVPVPAQVNQPPAPDIRTLTETIERQSEQIETMSQQLLQMQQMLLYMMRMMPQNGQGAAPVQNPLVFGRPPAAPQNNQAPGQGHGNGPALNFN